jgi:hypothetical protein
LVWSGDDPNRISRFPFDLIEDSFPSRGHGLQFDLSISKKESEVDTIAHVLTVDAHDSRSDLKIELFRDASSFNFGDPDHRRLTE